MVGVRGLFLQEEDCLAFAFLDRQSRLAQELFIYEVEVDLS